MSISKRRKNMAHSNKNKKRKNKDKVDKNIENVEVNDNLYNYHPIESPQESNKNENETTTQKAAGVEHKIKSDTVKTENDKKEVQEPSAKNNTENNRDDKENGKIGDTEEAGTAKELGALESKSGNEELNSEKKTENKKEKKSEVEEPKDKDSSNGEGNKLDKPDKEEEQNSKDEEKKSEEAKSGEKPEFEKITRGLATSRGLVNGTGLVNGMGLTNGNGLTNGKGLINGRGLVNGKGLVNGRGLVNGKSIGSAINGKYTELSKVLRMGYVNGEKLEVGKINSLFKYNRGRRVTVKYFSKKNRNVIISVLILIILVIPAFMYFVLPSGQIKIDGNFSDWKDKKPLLNVGGVLYGHISDIFLSPNNTSTFTISQSNITPMSKNVSLHPGDLLLKFGGAGNEPKSAAYFIYKGGDVNKSSSWIGPLDFRYAFSGSQVEFEIYKPKEYATRSYTMGYGFARDMGVNRVLPPISSWSRGSIVVQSKWLAPDVINNFTQSILNVELTDYNAVSHIKWLRFTEPSYASSNVSIKSDRGGVYYSQNHTYVFYNPISVFPRKTVVIRIYGNFLSLNGSTISMHVSAIGADAPYSIKFEPVHVSYLGTPPSYPRVDGGFAEWHYVESDAKHDVRSPSSVNRSETQSYMNNTDIVNFGRIVTNSTYYYVKVLGNILMGTYIGTDQGLLKIKDSRIPESSPEPAAPIKKDTDVLYIGIDSDNNINTGYKWMGIGADYLVKVTGRLQNINQAVLEKYTGGKWVITGAKVKVAISAHGLELSLPRAFKGRYVIYVDNWLNEWDTASELGQETRADVTNKVVINEIYVDSSYSVSWIELYNPTGASVDLSGWNLVNDANALNPEIMYTFPSGSNISSGEYLVITSLSNNNLTTNKYTLEIVLADSGGTAVDNNPTTNASGHGGESYARYWDADTSAPTDQWYWDSSPSEGSQNNSIPELSDPGIIMFLFIIIIGGVYGIRKKENK